MCLPLIRLCIFCLVHPLLFSPGTLFLVNSLCRRVYESLDFESPDPQEYTKLDKTIHSLLLLVKDTANSLITKKKYNPPKKHPIKQKSQGHLKINILESPEKFYEFSLSEKISLCLQFLKIRGWTYMSNQVTYSTLNSVTAPLKFLKYGDIVTEL